MGRVREWTNHYAKFEHHKYNRQLRLIHRDNKKGLNLGGGFTDEYSATARYPKKTRSLKVWRNFYALFPRLAEKDNFNGKTSNKMK
jgi:hypothetical protein